MKLFTEEELKALLFKMYDAGQKDMRELQDVKDTMPMRKYLEQGLVLRQDAIKSVMEGL
ncbi:hypothetical protein D3C78_1872210 [compost metagenome]